MELIVAGVLCLIVGKCISGVAKGLCEALDALKFTEYEDACEFGKEDEKDADLQPVRSESRGTRS